MAYNTLYNVGRRSHGVEVVFGGRSCDPDSSATRCGQFNGAGGWGPTGVTNGDEDATWIGNRNVFIYNNILYNSGMQSQWQHLAVYGPRSQPGNYRSQAPNPARTDVNLQVWWLCPDPMMPFFSSFTPKA